LKKIRGKLTYANVMATIAVFIAVGGASAFAASQLPHNSVGARQIKRNAVTGSKVKNGSLGQADLNFQVATEPANSVANNSITTSKIANGSVTASKFAKFTQLFKKIEVGAGKEGTAIVSCGKGEVLINGGGGFSSVEPGAVEKMTIASSREVGGSQVWAVEGFNGFVKPVTLEAEVLCLAG